ncbi:MAG: condensation domain-containing protein [Planctomycetaceae bacterium]|jgi:NRPS condensation-like uncharacterized protein|nr:condensation domain-containing protein [Planctomycetaceae bacterium]
MNRPFTPFEEYMLLDDRPAYPMDSFRLLHFSGEIDAAVLEASINAVARYQPMLRSVARKTIGFLGRARYIWEETKQPVFFQKISQENERLFPQPKRIDLFREPGFKVYFAEKENGSVALLQFHHSVSDGIGEMAVIADILTDYADRVEGKIPAENPRNLDPNLLVYRGKSGLTLGVYFRYYFDIAVTTRQLLFGKPIPLNSRAPSIQADFNAANPDYLAICSAELSSKETRQYFSNAKTNGVTVNDLMLRDLFLTIGDWRKRWLTQDATNLFDAGLIRISAPMNVRTEGRQNMPAANTVTMIFLDRKQRDFSDPQRLLQSVHREMNWVKRTRQKHVLLLGLRLRQFLPGGLAQALKSPKCGATCVLSNLGRVFDQLSIPRRGDGKLMLGSAVLEEIDATPPIRPGTLISISTLTYAGRIRIILRYDSQNMTPQQAKDFLQTLRNKM